MQAPDNIKQLVELFDRNIFEFKNSAYKEAHVRQEFINPFWSALGWDMANARGLSTKLKEVIHEDTIEIDGNKKAPDYAFRKAEQTKFYLEAKAPRIYLKEDQSPAFQIKSYAWSGGLPVSVLSDFEEFAVYQCTNRPKADDKTIKDRIAYFKYTDYIDKWEWLYETFSREAVYDGRFDTFANTYAKKRGTQSFDKAFLADMHEWRTKLAQNIALRNPWIDERELNYAVQATLDRIIFLRIAEDRGIEKYGNLGVDAGLDYVLEAKSTKKRKVEDVYKTLLKRFKAADDRYNSGLFHFSKEKERGAQDTLTPKLEIDDKVITKIIEQLYYPESPYAFDQVPADVLGSVYEQFLGQVITLSPSHKASIDYKPEVKKAGGVYYTPKYIVDYIVANTLGKLLEDVWCSPIQNSKLKIENGGESRVTGVPPVTPAGNNLSLREGITSDSEVIPTKQSPDLQQNNSTAEINKLHKKASTLKVLDPACGSGSFLLGAYQYLLDWYHKFYTQTDPTHWTKQKAIEPIPSPRTPDPGTRTPTQDYRLTTAERKKILLQHVHGVDIDSQAVEVAKLNLLLKASEGGNAHAQGQLTYDKNERLLPDLEKNIVCGNSLVEWDYITSRPGGSKDKDLIDAINPFSFEETFESGKFNVVIGNPPYSLVGADRPEEQSYLSNRYKLSAYKINTYLLFLERAVSLLSKDGIMGYIIPKSLVFNTFFIPTRQQILANYNLRNVVEIQEKVFANAEVGDSILLFMSPVPAHEGDLTYEKVVNVYPQKEVLAEFTTKRSTLLNDYGGDFYPTGFKLKIPTAPLSEFAKVYNGLNPGNVRHVLLADKKKAKTYERMVLGRDIQRYEIRWSGTWVNFDPDLKNKITIKDIKSKAGMTAQTKVDFALRDRKIYTGKKLLIRKTADRLICVFDDQDYYYDSLAHGVKTEKLDYFYLLGLLNSKLLDSLHSGLAKNESKVFAKVLGANIEKLPIPLAPSDKLVKAISSASKERSEVQPQSKIAEALDRKIDRLVYELYGLNEAEIKIVEGS